MGEIAYRTEDTEVLVEWAKWKAGTEEVRAKRATLSDEVGRNMYINRDTGFGSTRIVGFERLDSDKDGDLLHHGGCLVVSSKRSQHNGLVVPNLRRKAGKEFAEELKTYSAPSLKVPGMATFHVYASNGQMYGGGPALFVLTDLDAAPIMYALCQSEDWPVAGSGWTSIPLSEYHAAKEKMEAAK